MVEMHPFVGTWDTQRNGVHNGEHHARMIIVQEPVYHPGDVSVYLDGMWDLPGHNGTLHGIVRGNRWTGTWRMPDGVSGTFEFVLSSDTTRFEGSFSQDGRPFPSGFEPYWRGIRF